MKRENVLKENDLVTTTVKSSSDLTEMMKWNGIKKNDVLYSPIFGEVSLVDIYETEPKIIVRDIKGGLHKFDSKGRLNGFGEIMLYPNCMKKWEAIYEQKSHSIPDKEILFKENIRIKSISDNCYRLYLAAKIIDGTFEKCYKNQKESNNYVLCTIIDNCEKEYRRQPLSFGYGHHLGIGINRINRSTTNPVFQTVNEKIIAEIDLFRFNSFSAAVYFLQLFKVELINLYSGLSLITELLINNIDLDSNMSLKNPLIIERVFNNEIITDEDNDRSSPRQRLLSKNELITTYQSSDITKMMEWMNFKQGQMLYSSAFGPLRLKGIDEDEPKIKTIDKNNRIIEFTSNGKYFDMGEVILFPEKGKKWEPIKRLLTPPLKNEISDHINNAINHKRFKRSYDILYKLMVSAAQLNVFFEKFYDSNASNVFLCTFCVYYDKNGYYAAKCVWIPKNVKITHDYTHSLKCFHLFPFKSYSALYYFIEMFQSDIEFLYQDLFDITITTWVIPDKLINRLRSDY